MNKQLATTWLERDDVVLFVKTTGGWKVTQHLAKGNEYWLCHEKHEDNCLQWLNGCEVAVFDEVDVTCADDLKKETKLRCIYNGKKIGGQWWRGDEWYMDSSVTSKVKPKTITVNGFEVPAPVREKLKHGEPYYVPDVRARCKYDLLGWAGSEHDNYLFKSAIIHLTKENAIAHAKAMLGINPNDVSN